MLAQHSGAASLGLLVILLTWFIASWYLFRMMQRLLFGPPRDDLIYEDLRAGEAFPFVALLLVVMLVGIAPWQSLQSDRIPAGIRATLETIAWQK